MCRPQNRKNIHLPIGPLPCPGSPTIPKVVHHFLDFGTAPLPCSAVFPVIWEVSERRCFLAAARKTIPSPAEITF